MVDGDRTEESFLAFVCLLYYCFDYIGRYLVIKFSAHFYLRLPKMDTVKEMIKRAGWRVSLIPFFKCVCVYFIVCSERQDPEGGSGGSVGGGGGDLRHALHVLAKCAPIVCLIFFVLMQRIEEHNTPLSRRYCALVGVGLTLSCVGDASLARRAGGEAAGMAAFGGAHLAYITAFNAPPPFRLAPALALLLFTVAGIYSSYLTPPLPLQYLVPVYTFLLASMAWRALARALPPPAGPLAAPVVPLSARTAAAGALAFLISDGVLAYSMFNGPVPCRQFVVMSTYYVAQLGIAMSAAEFTREQRDIPPSPSPRLLTSDTKLLDKSPAPELATELAPELATEHAPEVATNPLLASPPEIAAQ